jgi:uncharacterized protein
VLLQSCRGTGGSEGEFTWWRDEPADGQATVAWLREQPWFNGVLGTVGPSYLGYVQWALALDPPPELGAMVVQVGAHDPHQTTYPGGAYAFENSLIAAVAMIHQGRGAVRFALAVARLQRYFARITRSLPLADAYLPAVGRRVPYIDETLRHLDREHPFWAGTDIGAVADRLRVPTLIVAGWQDLLLEQNLQQYARLRAGGCPSALLIGPWTHTNAFDKGAPVVVGESLAWLKAHLTSDSGRPRDTPVRVHVGGADEWRDLPEWPPFSAQRPAFLAPDGRLGPPPSGDGAVGAFRYDPADPTPSLGGALLSRTAGVRDNRNLESRPDVLTFTTDALTSPVEVIGPVTATVRISAPVGAHIDVFARLCDVDEAGRSRNVCDGLLRLPEVTSTEPVEITVDLIATAHRFRTGHRIRLQVSGGAHPRFARNPGTGEPLATATRLVATPVTVHAGSAVQLSTVDDLSACISSKDVDSMSDSGTSLQKTRD